MSNKSILGVLIATVSLFITPAVQAHALMSEATSWFAGFAHPLSGLRSSVSHAGCRLVGGATGWQPLVAITHCLFEHDDAWRHAWTNGLVVAFGRSGYRKFITRAGPDANVCDTTVYSAEHADSGPVCRVSWLCAWRGNASNIGT